MTLNKEKSGSDLDKTIYQVDGICCADCARKFEKAVNRLPKVSKATLNTMTGQLLVEGVADINLIRHLGKAENYVINLKDRKSTENPDSKKKINWSLTRAVISGLSLVIAFIMEKSHLPVQAFLPIYSLAMLIGGWGNLKKAALSLPRLNFNMSVLMSLAIIGAFAIKQYEEGATVAFLYAISEMLEAWTMEKSRRSLKQLMEIAPKTARINRQGIELEVLVEEINVGDTMIIYPGEKIAMDGEIIKGESAINQSAITGESIPVEKGVGAEVFAGTINSYGSLEVHVTKLVQDTTIAKIIHMVEEAQGKRAPSQTFVDKFASVYTPIVMIIAVFIICIPPLLLGYEWTDWIYRGLALLVVACPCALVVSTPVTIVSAICNAARNGVLIKGGIYLEEIGSLKAIAFDKTGTLTKGEPMVTDIVSIDETPAAQILEIAANIESRSEHPLALAIVKAAKDKGCRLIPVEDFSAIVGKGAKGTIDNQIIYVGNSRLFSDLNISLEPITLKINELQEQGKTTMIIGTLQKIIGIIAVADEIRQGSHSAIAALKRAGIQHTIMLTGDNKATAKNVAQTVGIDEFQAELLPQDKVSVMQKLIKKYGKVAMVGDGINDAPVLALSTVGIAMGGAGTDTALETSDIVLMADDLSHLPFTLRLSKKAHRVISQNISFSLIVKALAIMAVFPGWLTLWIAILADMGTTIIVTLNSLRLLNVKVESKN